MGNYEYHSISQQNPIEMKELIKWSAASIYGFLVKWVLQKIQWKI